MKTSDAEHELVTIVCDRNEPIYDYYSFVAAVRHGTSYSHYHCYS